MIGNFSGMELGILLVVVLLVVGPERLPTYAAQLGRVVREVRDIARGARERVKEEMGDSFEELRDLDPRQYDPRRILQQALIDEPASSPQPASRFVAMPPPGAQSAALADGAPFDDEAT